MLTFSLTLLEPLLIAEYATSLKFIEHFYPDEGKTCMKVACSTIRFLYLCAHFQIVIYNLKRDITRITRTSALSMTSC